MPTLQIQMSNRDDCYSLASYSHSYLLGNDTRRIPNITSVKHTVIDFNLFLSHMENLYVMFNKLVIAILKVQSLLCLL